MPIFPNAQDAIINGGQFYDVANLNISSFASEGTISTLSAKVLFIALTSMT
jgi:hypothetical protein